MSKMFDTEDKSTSLHVEKASQYKGAPVMCLIIAGVLQSPLIYENFHLK